MINIHLACLAGALFLCLIPIYAFSLDLMLYTKLGAIFVFYIGFFQVFQALKIPEKVIEKQTQEHIDKYKDEYIKEFEQMERKLSFQAAFATEEENAEKKKVNDELKDYNRNYELAKESFKNKVKEDMNGFEKLHFYMNRRRKMYEFLKYPSILIVFICGFLTLFNQHLTFQLILLLTIPFMIISVIFLLLNLKLNKKIDDIHRSVQPDSVKKLLDELTNL